MVALTHWCAAYVADNKDETDLAFKSSNSVDCHVLRANCSSTVWALLKLQKSAWLIMIQSIPTAGHQEESFDFEALGYAMVSIPWGAQMNH